MVALLHRDVLALRDQILDRLTAVLRTNDNTPLGLVIPAELDAALSFGDDRVVLGLARLEELCDTRQTTRDVTVLGGFTRNTGQDVAGLNLGPVLDRKDRVD